MPLMHRSASHVSWVSYADFDNGDGPVEKNIILFNNHDRLLVATPVTELQYSEWDSAAENCGWIRPLRRTAEDMKILSSMRNLELLNMVVPLTCCNACCCG